MGLGELWRDGTRGVLSSWLWAAQWISFKLQGVITSHLVFPVPPPSLSMGPQATNRCQLSALTAESLSGSWAMCHWKRNNKEQNPKHRDTRCTLWVFYHWLWISILYCTVKGYDEGVQSSYRGRIEDGCGGLTTCLVSCTVKWREGRHGGTHNSVKQKSAV